MRKQIFIELAVLFLIIGSALAADKTIGVFVALADNKSQGIVPVPAAIGNGDDPERNLYWGTGDGLKGVFDRSKEWKLTEHSERPAPAEVLRTRTYQHVAKHAVLFARAYKGSAIKACLRDYENAVRSGAYDLVVYIGHNGLMDFELPKPVKSKEQTRAPDCIVLCCKSEQYFANRIATAGGRPVLLTTQLMYPGAFLLHAAAESWLDGKNRSTIRESAGAAYAQNQKLSKKAGVGVFAAIKE